MKSFQNYIEQESCVTPAVSRLLNINNGSLLEMIRRWTACGFQFRIVILYLSRSYKKKKSLKILKG